MGMPHFTGNLAPGSRNRAADFRVHLAGETATGATLLIMREFSRRGLRDRVHKWRASVALAAGLALGTARSAGADRPATPPAIQPGPAVEPAREVEGDDARLAILRDYFRSQRSPLHEFAGIFLSAADSNGLDWRLLPALAMVESGGGRRYIRNNVFGWNSGRARFSSIPDSIVHIAAKLVTLPAYRGKDLHGILRAYNPARRDYAQRVLALIRRIAPDPPSAAPAVAR